MKLESENFTIYEVEELKEIFVNELNSNENIEVDLSNIQKIDMPALQLLISTKKSCEKENKTFEIKNINENIYKAFQLSGCDTALGV